MSDATFLEYVVFFSAAASVRFHCEYESMACICPPPQLGSTLLTPSGVPGGIRVFFAGFAVALAACVLSR